MKKLLAMLLVSALCLGLGAPALAADGAAGFSDVPADAWYADAVNWAADHGVTNGVSATEFGAELTLSRAQMVTFLWRMAGCQKSGTVRGFADVPAGAWYTDAVNWAASSGLAKGVSETEFDPLGTLTREQAATFLYREEQRRGGGFRGAWAFPLSYSDADQVSDDAYEALCWLTMTQVYAPEDGALAPKAPCSRAALVTMLYRYAEGLEPAAEPAYTEKEIPVLRERLESGETAAVRFYEDLPDVPYMELTAYYNQFYLLGTDLTEGLSAVSLGSHHVFTNVVGATAEFDTRTDTVVIGDFERFMGLPCNLLLTESGTADESTPFVLDGACVYTPAAPAPLTLRLGDYGIDLRGGADGLYLPLATLSDLWATTATRYTVYNGEKLYAQEYLESHQTGSALAEDPDFSAPLLAGRSEALADFTYRELCFNIDSFYGRPGQELVHDVLEDCGLDEVLSAYFPEVKAQLLATDFESYLKGLSMLLHGMLFDGGHTALTSKILDEQPELLDEATSELLESELGAGLIGYIVLRTMRTYFESLQDALYAGDWYVERGDTAMIRFDSFDVDSEGWAAFYAGTGDMPLEGDTVGTVYAGLQRAAANPEIRNVVIDVSCNDGGETAALYAIEWLMTGRSYINTYNRLTGQVEHEPHHMDANFDGAFDGSDRPFDQFRYGVLTSCVSFSCANGLPFFMHENGAVILGQQSSGGACQIRFSSAGGVEFACSAASGCFVSSAGESVDYGCPVDVQLYEEITEEILDEETGLYVTGYESFYDIDRISAAMNEFFAAAAGAAA